MEFSKRFDLLKFIRNYEKNLKKLLSVDISETMTAVSLEWWNFGRNLEIANGLVITSETLLKVLLHQSLRGLEEEFQEYLIEEISDDHEKRSFKSCGQKLKRKLWIKIMKKMVEWVSSWNFRTNNYRNLLINPLRIIWKYSGVITGIIPGITPEETFKKIMHASLDGFQDLPLVV